MVEEEKEGGGVRDQEVYGELAEEGYHSGGGAGYRACLEGGPQSFRSGLNGGGVGQNSLQNLARNTARQE